jgi:outer membrane protein assembly factor BamE (lipoprotein component of BamABCDE complex)
MTSNKHSKLNLQQWASILLTAVISLTTSGCLTIQVRGGEPFDTNKLESLQVGESSRDEVRSVLGKPVGKGSAMLPFHETPRETWAYSYQEGTLTETRQKFLFIYLDGSVYDGYMWFSSLPEK